MSASELAAAGMLEKGGARIQEHTLQNGMRVLIAERRADPVVASMLWYRVGARNEREHESGVSHFLEHMMFKGSRSFGKGEIDRITTRLGGSNNAFTSCDHTAYWFELASDRWETAIDIEVDRMRNLSLDPAEFASEREVVLEELSMGLDDPWRRLTDEVQHVLFARHPYRRPVIGYADVLRHLTVAEMRDYHARFYHPGNATLVLCGDLDPADALAKVRARFESIPAGVPYAEADCFRGSEEAPSGERRVQMTWDDQGKRMCVAWMSAAVATPDDWALDIISSLLSAGRMSRLHRRLVVEKELATSVSTHNDARVDGGVFWLFIECAQNADPARLEKALDEELARLMHEPVAKRELARVRSMLVATEAYDEETASDLAEQIGEFATDADWRLAVNGLERVLAVEAKAVRDCAARLLARERRVVGWCLPKRAGAKTKRRAKAKR